MLSEVFWVAFITTVSGMVIKLASMAYKSKCKECEVCCIKVKRDVELEIIADEKDFENKVSERNTTEIENNNNNNNNNKV